MPTNWETFPIKFEGGLTTNLGRIEQGINAPGSATILQNFEPDIQGGYTRILGYQKYSDTTVTGTGQILGLVALSDTEVLALRNGNYRYSTGTTWTDKLALASGGVTRITDDTYNFTGTKKTVVIDGVNPPAYFNHSSKAMAYAVGAPTDVVGASRVKVFKAHIFFAKGRLLSFSSPYLEDDFDPANGAGVINVGDDITGLAVFRDQLIVFCLNRIFRLVGNSVSDFALAPITNNTGCLCGFTIQEVGGDIMYLGPDGVRYLSASERDNDFGLTRASEKIQNKILSIVNTNCMYSSVTIASKNQYRLFTYISNVNSDKAEGYAGVKFSNQTSDNISWCTLKGFKVYDLKKYQNRDRENIFFCSDTGYVYRMEAGNSLDGSDIEAIFETPYMPISDPKIRKSFYKHTLYSKTTGLMTLKAQLRFDYLQNDSLTSPIFDITSTSGVAVYGALSSIYGTSVYGQIGEEQFFNNVLGSGFVTAIRYSNNSQNPPFNLNFAVLEFRNNERR